MKPPSLSKKIAIAVLAICVLSAVVLAALPRSWSVERSIVINAPEAKIVPYVVDLHRWQDWSPWTKSHDPLARFSFEGPQQGVGAKWSWLGPVMGRGQLEVTSAIPGYVTLSEALDGERVNANATFTFRAQGNSTVVTWRDSGELPAFGGVFVGSVERSLAKSFDAGLVKLKTTVEN